MTTVKKPACVDCSKARAIPAILPESGVRAWCSESKWPVDGSIALEQVEDMRPCKQFDSMDD